MTRSACAAGVEQMAVFVARSQESQGELHAAPATNVVVGTVSSAIHKVCGTAPIDFIVMGTRGADSGSLFGSNAAMVARTSRVLVLVVPEHARFNGLRRILLADDQKEVGVSDLRRKAELALKHRAEILIAHVLRDPAEEPIRRVIAAYDSAFASVPHRYIDATGEDVAMVLSVLAEREQADLVAVLHRHTGLLTGLFHGSVASRLALHGGVPLLVFEAR